MDRTHPVFTHDGSPKSISECACQITRAQAVLGSGRFNTRLMAEYAVESVKSSNDYSRFSETVQETQSRLDELGSQADSSELTPLHLSYFSRGDLSTLIGDNILTDEDYAEIQSTISDYISGFAEEFHGPQRTNFHNEPTCGEQRGGGYDWAKDEANIYGEPDQGEVIAGAGVLSVGAHELSHGDSMRQIFGKDRFNRMRDRYKWNSREHEWNSRIESANGLPWESAETERQIDRTVSTVSPDSGRQKAYMEARLREHIDTSGSASTQELKRKAETYAEDYDWAELKVRVEVLAQTVSCWLDGIFERPETDSEQEIQEERFEDIEEDYNNFSYYPENAGTEILNELRQVMDVYQGMECSPGEKFKTIYGKRQEYLREGEWESLA